MVSGYSDAGQQRWLAGQEIALLRGTGRLAEPAPLGEAVGEVLRRDGATVILGGRVSAARRDGADYVLTLADGRELRGDRLLVATGRRPRLPGGLDTAGVMAGPRGIPVDARLRAGERLWAVLAMRARVPLSVLRDTIQPFPAFTEIYLDALKALHTTIRTGRREQVAP